MNQKGIAPIAIILIIIGVLALGGGAWYVKEKKKTEEIKKQEEEMVKNLQNYQINQEPAKKEIVNQQQNTASSTQFKFIQPKEGDIWELGKTYQIKFSPCLNDHEHGYPLIFELLTQEEGKTILTTGMNYYYNKSEIECDKINNIGSFNWNIDNLDEIFFLGILSPDSVFPLQNLIILNKLNKEIGRTGECCDGGIPGYKSLATSSPFYIVSSAYLKGGVTYGANHDIQVISPTDQESTVKPGDTMRIVWQPSFPYGSFSLNLYSIENDRGEGQLIQHIIANAAMVGDRKEYKFKVPNIFGAYKIKIDQYYGERCIQYEDKGKVLGKCFPDELVGTGEKYIIISR